jgi:SAM-dependent methyltransferase
MRTKTASDSGQVSRTEDKIRLLNTSMTEQTAAFATLERHLERCPFTLKPAAKRVGIDSWFPYYAGYSPIFVREALVGLGIQAGQRVLDPWNGSGTTTVVADSLGCDALGFDINPVAALVAGARLARTLDVIHSSGLAAELLTVANRSRATCASDDPLRSWLSPRLTRRYRRIEGAILDLLGSRAGRRGEVEQAPPFAAFFLLCLMRAARRFIKLKKITNPTWITPQDCGDARPESLDSSFLQMVQACARDAERALPGRADRATSSTVGLADARSLPLPDASVDAVVTSPPYCTRIDYFRATLFELAALRVAPGSARYRELRSQAMGTNLMRTRGEPILEILPDCVRGLLQRIREHPSKASGTYYHRSFTQYFEDSMLALKELHRVLKPGSCGVLVVQSSYYKEIYLPLGEIYCAMAEGQGLRAKIVYRAPVRRVLATINSRANKHAPHRRYAEDVVAVQRSA